MKPILLLDMDGPLADFDRAFYEMCVESDYTLNITSLQDPARRRFMTDNIPDPRERALARATVDTTHWFRHLPVTPGAKDGVPELMEHFDVWVCTKPLEVNPWCRDDKYAWLVEHFPELHDRMIVAPKKRYVYGHVLLDDAPALDCAREAPWVPIVFSDVYNGTGSQWSHLPRWSWGEPIDHVYHSASMVAHS